MHTLSADAVVCAAHGLLGAVYAFADGTLSVGDKYVHSKSDKRGNREVQVMLPVDTLG